MYSRRDSLALSKSVLQDLRIHIHIGHFTAGARAPICGVDPDILTKFIDGNTISRIAGEGNHGSYLIQINFEDSGVLGIRITVSKTLPDCFPIEATSLDDVLQRH